MYQKTITPVQDNNFEKKLPVELIEMILEYLFKKDLKIFASTSKFFRNSIFGYLKHIKSNFPLNEKEKSTDNLSIYIERLNNSRFKNLLPKDFENFDKEIYNKIEEIYGKPPRSAEIQDKVNNSKIDIKHALNTNKISIFQLYYLFKKCPQKFGLLLTNYFAKKLFEGEIAYKEFVRIPEEKVKSLNDLVCTMDFFGTGKERLEIEITNLKNQAKELEFTENYQQSRKKNLRPCILQ